MKSNQELQKDVLNAISWQPLLKSAQIGVTALNGVITLTGTVDSYIKKLEAEDAAKSVLGVRAIAEEIIIQTGDFNRKSDTEIATAVINAWKWNWEVPGDKIQVKVEDGWVNLEGELEWNFQRDAAVKTIRNLVGLVGVSNRIKIKSEVADGIEKQAIEKALQRNSSLGDLGIQVEVTGNNVILKGVVNSFYAKDEAEQIAWNAPGVWTVDNELVIEN
jgi:osmotically-inducible protein OsmY